MKIRPITLNRRSLASWVRWVLDKRRRRYFERLFVRLKLSETDAAILN